MRAIRPGLAATGLTTLLIACGGPATDPDPAPCDGVPHGEDETRVRYQAESVPADAECIPQAQVRTCTDGTWSEWSGDYVHESCVVEGFASCDDTPHGGTESRIRFESGQVSADASCMSENQTRTCDDGVWSDWSGSYTYTSCIVDEYASCGDAPHGTTEERIFYEAETVPGDSLCVSETQTRTCDDGTWSDWSGSYAYDSCSVDGFGSCGNTPHGAAETRVRYEAESVPGDALCVSETQTRNCDNGTWTDWSGTFTYDSCSVDGFASCGDAPHGTSEERTRYEAETVPAGAPCVSETQTRACDDGTWTDWSGSYAYAHCTVDEPVACGDTPHGGAEERTRYEAETVPGDSLCAPETQTRTCDNGTWTAWSGTYTYESCSVDGFSNCGRWPPGTVLERVLYASWSVMPDSTCRSEVQYNTCDDGALTGWSGTYGYTECHRGCWKEVVTGWVQHGFTQNRTAYLEESPMAGELCQSEPQTRTCADGTWTEWSGTYTYDECTATGASCSGAPHGSVLDRIRFESPSVPPGESCNYEVQTRTCIDGTWTDWTGTYTYSSCVQDSEYASCGTTSHGGTEQRIRYESASVPAGSTCNSETQTRTCDDGNWSAWSGTYMYEDCTVESGGGGVATCDQSDMGYGTCHEFSGPNASDDVQAACSMGTIGTSCPSGSIGACDLSNIGTNPPGYVVYYYICFIVPDEQAAQDSCASAGGSWL